MCQSKLDFLFIATTADVVKALEGGPPTEASQRMTRDWIKSLFYPHCLNGIGSGRICMSIITGHFDQYVFKSLFFFFLSAFYQAKPGN